MFFNKIIRRPDPVSRICVEVLPIVLSAVEKYRQHTLSSVNNRIDEIDEAGPLLFENQ